MFSALDQEQGEARCIGAGADDYFAMPFNSVFPRARLGACLEKKSLRDRERGQITETQVEREKSDGLLLNILPQSAADRLKSGKTMFAEHFDCASCDPQAGSNKSHKRYRPICARRAANPDWASERETGARRRSSQVNCWT